MNLSKISLRFPNWSNHHLSLSEWISLISLVLLLLVLPLSIFISLSSIKLFSRAQFPITPPAPYCKIGVNDFSVNTVCGIRHNKYRFADFSCYDGYKERLGDSSQCKASKKWRQMAEKICRDHPFCPTPTSVYPTPTPTPPPACKTGVNSFSVIMACSASEFRFATFSCYDGYGGKLGSSDSCKSSAVWKRYAEEECKKHPYCGATPTVRPTSGLIPCPEDAKLCPDGSYVGRIPPNCEFAPCPTN